MNGVANANSIWTDADQAELDVLIGELLAEFERHVSEGCAGCRHARRSAPACVAFAPGSTAKATCAAVSATAGGANATGSEISDIPQWPSGAVERYKPTSRPARPHIIPGSVCPAIVAGVHVVLDWRAARIRRTRAEWLRAELDFTAWLCDLTSQQRLPGIALGLEEAA